MLFVTAAVFNFSFLFFPLCFYSSIYCFNSECSRVHSGAVISFHSKKGSGTPNEMDACFKFTLHFQCWIRFFVGAGPWAYWLPGQNWHDVCCWHRLCHSSFDVRNFRRIKPLRMSWSGSFFGHNQSHWILSICQFCDTFKKMKTFYKQINFFSFILLTLFYYLTLLNRVLLWSTLNSQAKKVNRKKIGNSKLVKIGDNESCEKVCWL